MSCLSAGTRRLQSGSKNMAFFVRLGLSYNDSSGVQCVEAGCVWSKNHQIWYENMDVDRIVKGTNVLYLVCLRVPVVCSSVVTRCHCCATGYTLHNSCVYVLQWVRICLEPHGQRCEGRRDVSDCINRYRLELEARLVCHVSTHA
jgi:hypothetical protein